MTKLGEELPKISRACVNNANSIPSLYNKACFNCEIINKHSSYLFIPGLAFAHVHTLLSPYLSPPHKQLLIKILLRPQCPVNRLVDRGRRLEHIII